MPVAGYPLPIRVRNRFPVPGFRFPLPGVGIGFGIGVGLGIGFVNVATRLRAGDRDDGYIGATMTAAEDPNAMAVMTDPIVPALRAERLPRRLGLLSAMAVLVGSTIGSGIFRVPASIAEQVGTVGAIALLWLVGAMVAVFGALTLAELAALYPRSGGIYVFLREAYGPLPAFLFGWTELLVIRPSALGALAILFAEYTSNFIALGTTGERVLAATAIALLAATNVRSVDWGAVIANVTTFAKVIALAAVALLAFLFGDMSQGALAQPIEWSPLSWGGFGVALISVMWAYNGWADLTFMSGEVKDPERTLPRALLGGVSVIVVIYLLVNLAYLWVLRVDEMAGSRLVAADAASRIFGGAGAGVISALVMLSAFGALNGSTMTGPRILYAMADDRLFFRPIAHVHPKYRTPECRDHSLQCAGHRVCLDPRFRAAGQRFHSRHLAILCAGRRRRVHPAQAASEPGAAVPNGRVSHRAAGVPDRIRVDARELGHTGHQTDADRFRHHPRRYSGLLLLAPRPNGIAA